MRTIRSKVFETNSSSTHSISIEGGTYVPDTFPVQDGVCKVYPGEFGWEEAIFHAPEAKASYCLTYVKTVVGKDEAPAKMLIGVLAEATRCKVEFVPEPGNCIWGYIDHQSYNVCGEAFESAEQLRDFIFNPKSYLETDNDNH